MDGDADGNEDEHGDQMKQDAERSKEKKYEELLQFYERLASKLVVFDPLNRAILDDDEIDMATK